VSTGFRSQDGRRWFCVAVLLSAAGCGRGPRPELGLVEGKVTLDGRPLAEATVRFTPRGPGRTAEGVTDSAGRYRLHYLRNIPGANVDRHAVWITTAREDAGRVESLPPRYHRRSQLEAVVRPGPNTIDFPLESARDPR
jgi:hypothetical protein